MTLGVVFDLDDTLYLEVEYVRSGFAAVAAAVAEAAEQDAGPIADMLWAEFSGTRRRDPSISCCGESWGSQVPSRSTTSSTSTVIMRRRSRYSLG